MLLTTVIVNGMLDVSESRSSPAKWARTRMLPTTCVLQDVLAVPLLRLVAVAISCQLSPDRHSKAIVLPPIPSRLLSRRLAVNLMVSPTDTVVGLAYASRSV
ncbi:MAG: hypothetical protein QXT81_05360, partial [Candidatus Bathyarchaeia archaeon]